MGAFANISFRTSGAFFWRSGGHCAAPVTHLASQVTLIPRGQAKGLTWFIPNDDPTLLTRARGEIGLVGRGCFYLQFFSWQCVCSWVRAKVSVSVRSQMRKSGGASVRWYVSACIVAYDIGWVGRPVGPCTRAGACGSAHTLDDVCPCMQIRLSVWVA